MLTTASVVYTTGREGYHLQKALENFPASEVLSTLAQHILDAGQCATYTAAMRRATELVENHQHIQNGSSVCRDTHNELKARLGTDPLPTV